MPAQGSVHNVQRAPHQTLGTRTRRRSRADAARSEPASYACAPRNRRASVRHAEDADGCDALSDEDAAEGGDRDGAARPRLYGESVMKRFFWDAGGFALACFAVTAVLLWTGDFVDRHLGNSWLPLTLFFWMLSGVSLAVLFFCFRRR